MNREKNLTTSNMYILRKRAQKLENILFLHVITIVHTLIIETSLAETVVIPILEIRNIYFWFIHSWIKN